MSLVDAIVSGVAKAFTEHFASMIWAVAGLAISATALVYGIARFRVAKADSVAGPKLEVLFFRSNGDEEVTIFLPFLEKTTYMVPLIFTIANRGNRTASNVEIVCEAHNTVIHREAESVSPVGSAMGFISAQEEGSTVHKTRAYRKIPSIPPATNAGAATGADIVEYSMVSNPTLFDEWIPFQDKDKVQLSARVRAEFSIKIDMSISCTDLPPVRKQFVLNYRKGCAASIKDDLREEANRIEEWSTEDEGIPHFKRSIVVTFDKFEEIPPPSTVDIVDIKVLKPDYRTAKVGSVVPVLNGTKS